MSSAELAKRVVNVKSNIGQMIHFAHKVSFHFSIISPQACRYLFFFLLFNYYYFFIFIIIAFFVCWGGGGGGGGGMGLSGNKGFVFF